MHQLAPSIARSLLALMSACCDQIDSPAAWEVLLSLLESTTSHPDSVLPVHAALDTICRDGRGMCAANYMHVVTAVRALVVSACSAWMSAEQAREAGREAALPFDDSQIRGSVDLLELVANWLQTWRQRQAQVLRASLVLFMFSLQKGLHLHHVMRNWVSDKYCCWAWEYLLEIGYPSPCK